MKHLGRIPFDEYQRDRFRNGTLVKEWARKYPSMFDQNDVNNAINQPSYHFFEWLAAIVIFSCTGYLSLVEKYRHKKHARKRQILTQLFDADACRHICMRGVQCPDLLCYSPDLRDCFFCEVKGPRDRIRDVQVARFEALQRATGKEVMVMEVLPVGRHKEKGKTLSS